MARVTLLWPKSTLTQTWCVYSFETWPDSWMKIQETKERGQSSSMMVQSITSQNQHWKCSKSYRSQLWSVDLIVMMQLLVSYGFLFSRESISIPERSKQAKGKYIFKSRRQYLRDEFKVLTLFGLATYQGLNLIIVLHDFILAASN